MVCVGDIAGNDVPLAIAEGLEDLLSAVNLTGTRGIATLGKDRLTKIRLKPGTPVLLIAQKKDDVDRIRWENVAQYFAAQGCDVEIVWPGKHGDLNDLLKAEGPDAVRAAIENAEALNRSDLVRITMLGGGDEDPSGENADACDDTPRRRGNYRVSRRGMEFFSQSPNAKFGSWIWVSNFVARIKSQIRMDDGVEATLTFEIEAHINDRVSTFFVLAA